MSNVLGNVDGWDGVVYTHTLADTLFDSGFWTYAVSTSGEISAMRELHGEGDAWVQGDLA